ncbi:immunoglobulin-like domain-containing protein [Xylocopilactobacillus apis]|uniref:Pesticidal crystal protein Cry22Aa Ig-like domain-containing protein n=1 Tax=Xylocopilactobacillus apis TaxID=2932183 RepID=A0AAU9DCN0_9LACO|nr:immunoglobulin-like domain-containing protein [Xylocopilactobacillus apis]BDR57540.1 hypothetical protein KIMC2_21020 [Xylocopilactobacillus apis]
MKKSSRITNTIKYFGISSATLLAAAPVVAPTVTNVLGWYGANSVFTTKTSNKAHAATELGTFDRTGYSEYDNLFQNGVMMSQSSGSPEPGTMTTIETDMFQSSVGPAGVSYATLEGIQKLAQLTGGYGSVPEGTFVGGKLTTEDLSHYLFSNTDGSIRTSMDGLSNNANGSLQLNDSRVTKPDLTTWNAGERVAAGVRYISSMIHNGTISGILGKSTFGDPNKATVKVYVDGKNGATTPSVEDLLHEGTITITLVAQSGDYTNRTAQANIVLKNSKVLFNGAKAVELSEHVSADVFLGSGFNGNSLLSNISDLATNLPKLSNLQLSDTSSGVPKDVGFIPKNAVPYLQTGGKLDTDPASLKNDFFRGIYTDWNKLDSASTKHADDATFKPWQDNDPKAADYVGGHAAYLERNGYTGDETKALRVENENVGAYATGSIVVPAGTTYEQIKNYMNTIKFNGAPSSQEYGNNPVANPLAMGFDNVKAKPGNLSGYTWDQVFNKPEILKNFSDKNGGNGTTATSLDTAVASNSFSVEVPVYGDISIANFANEQMHYDIDTGGNYTVPAYPTYDAPRSTNHLITDYGASKDRVFARVNVIVYNKNWENYTIGTKPSFLFFTKSTTTNTIFPTMYDDGSILNQNELPDSLNKALTFSVNDSRFTSNGTSGYSAQKLESYIAEQFGAAVKNKEVLISDEDKATSEKKINLDALPADTDYPNANKYTVRSDIKGSNIKVDASKVDLTKAGAGTLTITYTNSKNEHGIGTETSTITVPYQVAVSGDPVFYFVKGNNQTINVGDSFDPMMFKVTRDQESMKELIDSGKVYDGAPYVNDPTNTGLSVTVTGSVDTNKPGDYALTYVAKNLSSGATTTMTRYITVLAQSGSDYNVTDYKATGYINYVPGFGINVYDAPNGTFTGQRLRHGTAWKISHQAVSNKDSKDVWYQVGKNQWIKGQYVSMTPVDNMTRYDAVGQVDYVPGYSVKVWKNSDGTGWTGKYLKHGTKWKVKGEQNGYYNLGGNQWVAKKYIALDY